MNQEFKKAERVGIHDHIKNLESPDSGIIGLESARKALLQAKSLLKLNKTGQIILIKGPSSAGKSALISGFLKDDFLNNSISSVELLSNKISKSEAVTQALRKSIRLKVKENIKVIEGEVTTLSTSKIGLKTLDMESVFEIGDKMQRQIQKEKIVVGDVIRIVKERGKIIKLGISASRADPDLLGDLIAVPCPEGEMFKSVEEIQNISIHDLDVLNNKTHGYLGLYDGETGEIGYEIRKEVNEKIKKWILEGKVEVERGILHIDNAHMLDDEILSFISKSSESSFCPLILLVFNTDVKNVSNLLKSALVINLNYPSLDDIRKIIDARANRENISLDKSTLEFLTSLSKSFGLSYALNILSVCGVKSSTVSEEEVKKMAGIFLDAKRAYERY